jgi:proline racemase
MRQTLPCIETHTCGEPTRILTMFNIPGSTISAKQDYVRHNLDHVRKALIREPRGHRHMFGAIVTAPVEADSACGVIWFDNQDYLNGCGHATIGLGVALVETGMVPHAGSRAQFSVDAPSGPLQLTVNLKDGVARETTFRNVPAFSLMLDVPLDVPGIGRLKMDVAYGGNFFGIVDARELGIEITGANMSRIADLGVRIREVANDQVEVRHPVQAQVNRIGLITFRSPARNPQARYLNTHVFANGAVDRSPGGTGTSAVLANLHARGEIAVGEEIVAEGIAGGLFRGRLLERTTIGAQPAVIPEVTGSAFVTSYHQFVIDSEDPFAQGFEMQ